MRFSDAKHPSADIPLPDERKPLLEESKHNSHEEENDLEAASPFINHDSAMAGEVDDELTQPPSSSDQYSSDCRPPSPVNNNLIAANNKPTTAAHGDEDDGLVTWSNFFDPKKGALRFWSPSLTWSQLTTRERDPSLFCFDAFRAFAFLWVSNSHLLSGMALYYGTSISTWTSEKATTAIGDASAQGVSVFFVIAGFLNLMVSGSISRRLKDRHFSLRSACTFMFRRYMHLCPNLYVAVCIGLFVGCISGLPALYDNFCVSCEKYWWYTYLLTGNFTDMMGASSNCFDTLWTVPAQMQMYLCCIPLKALYKANPLAAFIACTLLIIGVEALRTKLVIIYGDNQTDYSAYVYEPFYCRVDAYLMGMILWMIYEQILKPIKKQTFVPAHLRDTVLAPAAAAPPPLLPVTTNKNDIQEEDGQQGTDALTPSQATTTTSATLFDKFTILISVFIIDPIQEYLIQKHRHFLLFHTYAPTWMIVSMWILWPVMLTFVVIGFQFVFASTDYVWWWQDTTIFKTVDDNPVMNNFQESYFIFAAGVGSLGLLFFALEGTIAPWTWFCAQYIWYTIGLLSYTGYLLSILTSETFFSILLYYNNNEQVEWSINTSFFVYMGWYFLVVGINLTLAMVMSFVIERPFLNLSKAVEIWPWAEIASKTEASVGPI